MVEVLQRWLDRGAGFLSHRSAVWFWRRIVGRSSEDSPVCSGQAEMAVPLEEFFAAPLGAREICVLVSDPALACWAKFFASPPGFGSTTGVGPQIGLNGDTPTPGVLGKEAGND
jgi:hypothetical protein